MKNLKLVLLVISMLLTFSACNDKSKIENNKHETDKPVILGSDLELTKLKNSYEQYSNNDSLLGTMKEYSKMKLNKANFSKEVLTNLSLTEAVNRNLGSYTRLDMNKLKTTVQILDGKRSAGVTVPGFGGINLGKSESNLNVYYLESKNVTIDGKTVTIGVGYSIHYLFKQLKGGLSISNLAAVAASAQLDGKKTQVFYTMQTYGIAGNDVSIFFKPTFNRNFDVEGFSIMQSNVDGVHKILTGEVASNNTRFTPEIINYSGSLTF